MAPHLTHAEQLVQSLAQLAERRPFAVAAVGAAVAVFAAVWLIRRWRRPTADELERLRRLRLHGMGRLVAGEILEMLPAPVEAPAGVKTGGEPGDGAHGLAPLLVYQYSVAGVTYQVSQALHLVPIAMDPESWIPGWPVQVKYDPANPGNSIVACEHWCGLSRRPGERAKAAIAAKP